MDEKDLLIAFGSGSQTGREVPDDVEGGSEV